MIYALISFGGWMFWLSLAAVFILVSYVCTEKPEWSHGERLTWSIVWSVVGTAAILAFVDVPAPTTDLWMLAGGLAAYLGVGFVYAVVRWRSYVRRFYQIKRAWVAERPQYDVYDLGQHMYDNGFKATSEAYPSNYKSLLWIWSAFYVFDLFGRLIRNPLELVVKLYGKVFTKITEEARRG